MSTWAERYDAALMKTFGTPARALVRGEGPWVWDSDGTRYLDLLGGIAVNALGHAHPRLVAAIADQAGTLTHVSNLFTTRAQIDLAEKLDALYEYMGRRLLEGNARNDPDALDEVIRLLREVKSGWDAIPEMLRQAS